MEINKKWHMKNKMPKNANAEQRIEWHIEHQKNCRCRPMPNKLKAEIRKNNKNLPKKKTISAPNIPFCVPTRYECPKCGSKLYQSFLFDQCYQCNKCGYRGPIGLEPEKK
ncbi:MAG: hypothetical protein V1900_02420 [Candidatus Aenigmatarchaeota archaeon]